MFIATDNSKQEKTDYPAKSSIAEKDWHILASFWHPVKFAKDIGDAPVHVRLLDVDLVLYRTSAGVSVARDRCPHRGTALSLGWMENDKIVCPFHGFSYNGGGQCTKIPSMSGPNAKIPKAMQLETYLIEERYGLLWVCLKEEPIVPIPRWDPLENSTGFDRVTFQGTWNASAPRHVENFNDTSHLSWVHANTFGDRDNPESDLYDVLDTEHGLYYEREYRQRITDKSGEVTGYLDTFTKFEFTFPFTSTYYLQEKDGEILYALFDVASPISATECELFAIGLAKEGTGNEYEEFQTRVIAEDIPIVESQVPQELPLDITDEVHVPMDIFSIRYRRALVGRFGLGSPSQ